MCHQHGAKPQTHGRHSGTVPHRTVGSKPPTYLGDCDKCRGRVLPTSQAHRAADRAGSKSRANKLQVRVINILGSCSKAPLCYHRNHAPLELRCRRGSGEPCVVCPVAVDHGGGGSNSLGYRSPCSASTWLKAAWIGHI